VYGSTPHLIHARRSKYTYGIETSRPWTSDAPDKEWVEDQQGFFTHKAMCTYVSKGEQVLVKCNRL
jgi:hypothetical protein